MGLFLKKEVFLHKYEVLTQKIIISASELDLNVDPTYDADSRHLESIATTFKTIVSICILVLGRMISLIMWSH